MAIKESTIKRAIAEADKEAQKILREEPVRPLERHGRPSMAPQFEHLSTLQRNFIRKALQEGVKPRSLAIKYGVKTVTIQRIGSLS
jgi:hypothetical protein